MQQRVLGRNGPSVTVMGLGCMGGEEGMYSVAIGAGVGAVARAGHRADSGDQAAEVSGGEFEGGGFEDYAGGIERD